MAIQAHFSTTPSVVAVRPWVPGDSPGPGPACGQSPADSRVGRCEAGLAGGEPGGQVLECRGGQGGDRRPAGGATAGRGGLRARAAGLRHRLSAAADGLAADRARRRGRLRGGPAALRLPSPLRRKVVGGERAGPEPAVAPQHQEGGEGRRQGRPGRIRGSADLLRDLCGDRRAGQTAEDPDRMRASTLPSARSSRTMPSSGA